MNLQLETGKRNPAHNQAHLHPPRYNPNRVNNKNCTLVKPAQAELVLRTE